MSGVIYNYLTWMMNNRLFITVVSLLFCLSLAAQGGRWTEERAWAWYRQLPWLCGVNYIPANAINYTAMWDKTSFSPTTIDKELQLMENLGMNCVRVVLQHAVYADDAKYFLRTFDKFLDICSRHGIRVMPIFFDDCSFGVNNDPVVGRQPEPLVGWYAWAWSPSPGYTILADERRHPAACPGFREARPAYPASGGPPPWPRHPKAEYPQGLLPTLMTCFLPLKYSDARTASRCSLPRGDSQWYM